MGLKRIRNGYTHARLERELRDARAFQPPRFDNDYAGTATT